jgi:hypothetical protein
VTSGGTTGVGSKGANLFQVSGLDRKPLKFQIAGNVTVSDLRVQLRDATAALGEALRSFKTETKPVFETSLLNSQSRAASISGLSARRTAVIESYSRLRTTQQINARTTTERSSSRSLGLDVTSAEHASVLYSEALGLDLTSVDAPSQLSSSALGLDLTSAETASALGSSTTLGLNLTPAASTRRSAAEMNTATTSYGTSSLHFEGPGLSSTSVGTLTGTYTGVGTAVNATSLTVKMKSTSLPNALLDSNVKFEVHDQDDTVLFDFNGYIKAGEEVYLGDDIGLSISFSEGRLNSNNIASTTVSHNPISVNPNAAFNNSNPSLRPQFDNNAQVTAGSFKVNGKNITVAANDTISTVIARINAAGAGVVASLLDDRITLTTNAPSESDIVLSNDTSGFLSATRLETATTVRGNIRDDQQVLSATPQFGAVASGAFTVNGTSISVNKDSDTLTSVIDRINSSGAGVTASYDASQDRVVLATNSNSEDLIRLENDTSGFLTAAGLSSGNTNQGNIRDDQQVLSKTTQFGAVTSGSFTINGTSIAIDTSVDTFESVLTKINTANAGVSASYDSTLDKLVLAGTSNSEDLIVVANDTTGFLSVAGLSTSNTVRGHLAEDTVAFQNLSQFSSITHGSFVVDGRTIEVTTSDSIQSIVSKINASGAGVTAAFDASTNKLSFTTAQNTEAEVSIGNDSSGFLAAAGIQASNTLRGNIRDDRQVLSQTSQFGSVRDGVFEINGVRISVDADHDSLNTLIDKINGSGAAVTASYDSAADKIVLQPDVAGAPLNVENDTSGFLAAAQIAAGATGTKANPDAAFNGTGLNAPLFDGATVQAGSFTVNGVTIEVAADDSVNSVLAKITDSAAGVTATYDDTTETVSFATKGSTTTAAITVGNDTSGFLEAIKLNGTAESSIETRSRSAFDVALSQMAEYAGVQAGTITLNGRQVNVDPASTTIRGLIDAFNGITDVSARIDQDTGKLGIASLAGGRPLTIADDSGVLARLGVKAGVYRDRPGTMQTVQTPAGSVTVSNAEGIADEIVSLAAKVNDTLSQLDDVEGGSQVRKDAEANIEAAIAAMNDAGLGGLSIDKKSGRFAISVDRRQIITALDGIGSTISAQLDLFAGRMADIDTAPIGNQRSPISPLQFRELVEDQRLDPVSVKEMLAQMLFPTASSRKALDAYSEGTDSAVDDRSPLQLGERLTSKSL